MEPKLSVGIIGSRGVPNRYGGFEMFAQEISVRLVERGHRVTVYCSGRNQEKHPHFRGVALVFKPDPEGWTGPAGQFVYDLGCNLHSHREKFDIILHLGYTSDSVWHHLWHHNAVHITNMDGMEWQRAKYSALTKAFLKWAESRAAKASRFMVADSPVIRDYLERHYNTPVDFISYGVDVPQSYPPFHPPVKNLQPFGYDLVIARMEPENNIETAIRAKLQNTSGVPLLIFSNRTGYGATLRKRYKNEPLIRFMAPLYDPAALHSIRHFSRYYLHGHSAGGTNPSLLEAMACQCRILAHDNPFNRAVLNENACYYMDPDGLAGLLSISMPGGEFTRFIQANLKKIRDEHSWNTITDQYEKLFHKALGFAGG